MNPAEFKKLYLAQLEKIGSSNEDSAEIILNILNFIETETENYSTDEIKELIKEIPKLVETYIALLKQHLHYLTECGAHERSPIHYTTLVRFTNAAEENTPSKTLGLELMQNPTLLQKTLAAYEAITNAYKQFNRAHPLPPTAYPSQYLEGELYNYWRKEQQEQAQLSTLLDSINKTSTLPEAHLNIIDNFNKDDSIARSRKKLENQRVELEMLNSTKLDLRSQLSLCQGQERHQEQRIYFISQHVINTRRVVAQLQELQKNTQKNQKDTEKSLEKLPQLLSELENKKKEYQQKAESLEKIARQIQEKETLELELLHLCKHQEQKLLKKIEIEGRASQRVDFTYDPRSSSSYTTQASPNDQQKTRPQEFENKPKRTRTKSLTKLNTLENAQNMREHYIELSKKRQAQEKQDLNYRRLKRHQKQHEELLNTSQKNLTDQKEEILKETIHRYTSNRANMIAQLQKEPPALQSERYLQYLRDTLTERTETLRNLQELQKNLEEELTQTTQNVGQPSQAKEQLLVLQKITDNEKHLEIKTLELKKIKQLTQVETIKTRLKQEEALDLQTNQLSLWSYRGILTTKQLKKEEKLLEKKENKNKEINKVISKTIELFNKFETRYKKQLQTLQAQHQEETPSIHPALSRIASSSQENGSDKDAVMEVNSEDNDSFVNSHQESRKRSLSDLPLPRPGQDVGVLNFLYFLQKAKAASPSSPPGLERTFPQIPN